MQQDPGVGEIEWLADLKSIAETVGAEVLGFPIEWRVESLRAGRGRRHDVRVLGADQSTLLVGEAKRPTDPLGAHALVSSLVDDALSKALERHAPFAFTTNFHEMALLDARPGVMSHFDRLRGNPTPIVDPALASAPGWWSSLPVPAREDAVRAGFRTFFSNYRSALAGRPIEVSLDDVVLGFLQTLTERLVDSTHPQLVRSQQSTQLPREVVEHALRVGLDLGESLDCRYLAAQAVAEILTAALFYEVLQGEFSLPAITASLTPDSDLAREIQDAMTAAMQISGDYESIFDVSPAARWLLGTVTQESHSLWLSLLVFVARVNASELSSDVLGTVFERLISPDRRRQMGQHYTQPRVARSMVAWAVRDQNDVVLDPACGAGTFLVEAYRRLRDMGLCHAEALQRVFGNDLDPFAVHLASINLATRQIRYGENYPAVHLGDAFELRRGMSFLTIRRVGQVTTTVRLPDVTVVVGNPPYARAPEDPRGVEDQLRALRAHTRNSVLVMERGNLAAWFLPLSSALLSKAHRIALLMTVGVLQNQDLVGWREWWRSNWDVVIWHTEEDVWFSEARISTCALLLSPKSDPHAPVGSLYFVEVQAPVAGDLRLVDGVPSPHAQCTVRNLTSLHPSADILAAGTKPGVLQVFEGQEQTACLQGLEADGVEITTGKKLGHPWYKLKELEPGSTREVMRLEGLGVEVRLPRAHHRPLLSSPKQLSSGLVGHTGTRLLTLPRDLPRNPQAREYVTHGRRVGVPLAPSVACRGPSWWALDTQPARIAIPLHYQFQHQLGWFEEPGIATNNFHTIRFDAAVDLEQQELIGATLASAFGALSWLYVSEEVGCEGGRTVALFHLKEWPVLNPFRTYNPSKVQRALRAFRAYRQLPTAEIDSMDSTTLTAWLELTEAVADLAGLPLPANFARDVVSECVSTVVRRKARETSALGARSGAAGRSSTLERRVRRQVVDSDLFRHAVELLTCGPTVIRTRPVYQLRQRSLLDEPAEGLLAREDEEHLTELLGTSFECAPPRPDVHHDEWVDLRKTLVALIAAAVRELAGPEPSSEVPAAVETWRELADNARRLTLTNLQRSVNEVLR